MDFSAGNDLDNDHAAVRQIEARMCASDLYTLKSL